MSVMEVGGAVANQQWTYISSKQLMVYSGSNQQWSRN